MTTPTPPRPIYTPPAAHDHGLVPRGWLEGAPVTRTLLALNVCVFVVQEIVTRLGTELTSHTGLAFGASYSLATVAEGRYETLLTACFLHANLMHVAFNMIALWQAGPLVERAVGSARMAPMYLVAGVFGNLLSVLRGWFSDSWGTTDITVGASGAIAGVIAAALVVSWRASGWRAPLTQAMARWLGLIVVFGVVSNLGGARIDNAAHVGGALAGAAIAALWRRGVTYSRAATTGVLAACGGIVLACIAMVVVHDRADRFASMDLRDRLEFTDEALRDQRCGDAHDGIQAVGRLNAPIRRASRSGPRPTLQWEDDLRRGVEDSCGRLP